MLTISVMVNSTRPEAISAPRPVSFASPNALAMLAAMVLPPFWIRLNEMPKVMPRVSARAMVSPRARQGRASSRR
ncbi:hypothetical protein NKG94_39230 [Micromonospora sp. M12]